MRANTFRFVVRGTTSVYFRLTPETSTGTNIPLRCNVRTRTFLLGTRSKRQLRNVFRRFFAPAYTTRRLSVPMKTRTSFFHSHCAYYSRRFSVCQAPFLIFSTAAKSCAFARHPAQEHFGREVFGEVKCFQNALAQCGAVYAAGETERHEVCRGQGLKIGCAAPNGSAGFF